MKKEILENQVLTSQMLYYDKPLKEVVFTGPRPTPRPGSHEMPPMALRDAVKPVEILANGDVLFRFFAPDAKLVEVAGWGGGFPRDRVALSKGDDGWWSGTVSGILPGFHYHDFFVEEWVEQADCHNERKHNAQFVKTSTHFNAADSK